MELDRKGLGKNLICVEYPGVVKNVDKMLETLGGIRNISNVYSKRNRRLELRFRPDDIYCKPACGDRFNTNGVLLKIKVLKSKNSDEIKIKNCEILGRIQTSFKFKSICDFQYLPMLTNEKGEMVDITSTLLPSRVDGENLKAWLDAPAEYFLPPAVFSRVDSQQSGSSYMYRKDTKDGDSNVAPLIGRTRKRRSGHAIFVSFNIGTIPIKPREKALKFLEVKFLNGPQLEKIKKCFEERPVWSKLALMCVTKFQHDQLKYLLPAVAYYFVTGPFRVMWVRFGYDPRKDPNARVYQTLDYRIRAPAGLLSLVKSKRSYANYLLPTKSSHPGAKSVVITKDLITSKKDEPNDCSLRQDSYLFKTNVIPAARQMFYQYCDIKAPEIEVMLGRLPKISPNMACDPKHGWLPPGFDIQCRDIINGYVLQQMNKETAIAESTMKEYVDDSTDEETSWVEDFEEEEIDDIDSTEPSTSAN
ncbi:general transcription factor 3C polypeptide 5 [Cimex lectularius]|uniref:General transcription factor 3C polypeptide 5 n=1 Tax=Cimex lectularius TaxID=79782 RepID=A0A8I6RYQ9_CIMLE|nr:general transcription factor 3C polypeptide 5 [Cimex lectularius]